MTILSIETSCDETAVSVLEADEGFPEATYRILGNALNSQVKLHAEYGGVFPSVAKREHAKALVPLLEHALTEAHLLEDGSEHVDEETRALLEELLYRETDLAETIISFFETHRRPDIDLIAVTSGPGLEPALWVGINFAKALSALWNIPIVAVDHMEGHILAALLQESGDRDQVTGSGLQEATGAGGALQPTTYNLQPVSFPALALLISGGHTELVLIKEWGSYQVLGETLDDAVGEAFDKVARMLELPYPGGPEISKLAEKARREGVNPTTELPRPMLNTPELNFSFSGLKTAVLYAIKAHTKTEPLSEAYKKEIALDFENAVTEVLVTKTQKALKEYGVRSVILGGGVSANKHIRNAFNTLETEYAVEVHLPRTDLTTDNAIMIGIAGHAHQHDHAEVATLRARGNQSLTDQ